jgi:hypothetical protein
MRKWSRHLAGAIAIAGLFVALARVSAETATLELKRLDSSGAVRIVGSRMPLDYLCRYTYPQYFHMRVQDGKDYTLTGEARQAFSGIVKKEPKYEAEHPLRGVAELGSQRFAFAIDAKPPAAEAKPEASDAETEKPQQKAPQPPQYGRLFFDLNCNGDLTDDDVIESEQPRGIYLSLGSTRFSFRMDVPLNVEGTKMDYAFTLSGYVNASGDSYYATASLNAAAYREGEITLDGKTHHVVLIDFNSNGRFDDPFKIREGATYSDGRVVPQYGDVLLVDPNLETTGYRSPYDVTTSADQYHVAKVINVGGRYYDLEIAPAGDELTLKPSSVPVGYVTNPNDGFRAVLYGQKEFVKISGDKSKPVPVPEGEWKLLSYTIDLTGRKVEEEEEKAEEPEEGPSLLKALANSLLGGAAAAGSRSRPRYTLVSAQATGQYEPVKVRPGQTVALPFGPPYKPVVKVDYMRGREEAQLGLALIGSAGERCTNLMVDGGRPDKPTFSIAAADGTEVASGQFEYG